VVKFGGKALSTPWKIKKAAESVKLSREQGHSIVVVVSALESTTDRLKILCDFFSSSCADSDTILSHGELLSARVFSIALKQLGISTHLFTPGFGDWPILTDSVFGKASILSESNDMIRSLTAPLLDSKVPVFPGFIGKDKRGNITTLGRGSSDLTLFYLAHCLNADEVIKVTDVEGVYDESGKICETLTLRDFNRIQKKSWIILPKAIEYFGNGPVIKVISHKHGRLDAPGTVIRRGDFLG